VTARTSSDPADVVRRILESWDEGRLDAALALIHPDIEWHEPPDMPDQTIAHGREAALKALQTWFATWSTYENELRAVQEAGERVLVEYRQRMVGAGSSVAVESDLFQVWTVRDGLAVRMEMYTDRAQAVAALA
jgi:ketosteroid isomerase-like protein